MWIGRPGALREITDGPARFDRSPDLGVSEFRALSGGVTTWTPPVQARRLSVSWSLMEAADVTHLDRLARRVEGPGPVAVYDPLTRNVLAPAQSLGQGEGRAWTVTAGSITAGGGTSSATVTPSAGAELVWTHSTWPGFPATPGMRVWFWAPNFGAVSGASIRLYWRNAAGVSRFVSSHDVSEGPLSSTCPADMYYVSPVIRFPVAGTYTIGPAVLSLGTLSAPDAVPLGEGCPAMSITDYTHAASAGNGQFRDIGLTLVEVTNAAG